MPSSPQSPVYASDQDPVPSGAILHGSIDISALGGDGRTEVVRSMQFLSNEEQLMVSTNERLLLINVPKGKNVFNAAELLKIVKGATAAESTAALGGLRGERTGTLAMTEVSGARTCPPDMEGNPSVTSSGLRSGPHIINGRNTTLTPARSSSSISSFTIAPSDIVTLTPRVGFVIKTKRSDGRKIFINVTHHESLPVQFPEHQCSTYRSPLIDEVVCDEELVVVKHDVGAGVEDMIESESCNTQTCNKTVTRSADHRPFVWTALAEALHTAVRLSLRVPVSQSMSLSLEDQPPPQQPFLAVSEEAEAEDKVGEPSSVYTAVISTALFAKLDKVAVKEVCVSAHELMSYQL